jgi:hypothetical protein
VLPGPRVSVASRFLALPHPAAAHRAPLSPDPTCQPLRLRRSRPPLPLFTVRPPLSEWSRAVTPVPCRLTRCHTSAPPSPLLLPPPRGTEPDPLPFSFPPTPPSRHKRASPDAVPRFARFPLAHAGALCLLPHFLPLDAPVHRRRPRGAGFRPNCVDAHLRR